MPLPAERHRRSTTRRFLPAVLCGSLSAGTKNGRESRSHLRRAPRRTSGAVTGIYNRQYMVRPARLICSGAENTACPSRSAGTRTYWLWAAWLQPPGDDSSFNGSSLAEDEQYHASCVVAGQLDNPLSMPWEKEARLSFVMAENATYAGRLEGTSSTTTEPRSWHPWITRWNDLFNSTATRPAAGAEHLARHGHRGGHHHRQRNFPRSPGNDRGPTGSSGLVYLAWIAGGLLSLFGGDDLRGAISTLLP